MLAEMATPAIQIPPTVLTTQVGGNNSSTNNNRIKTNSKFQNQKGRLQNLLHALLPTPPTITLNCAHDTRALIIF